MIGEEQEKPNLMQQDAKLDSTGNSSGEKLKKENLFLANLQYFCAMIINSYFIVYYHITNDINPEE